MQASVVMAQSGSESQGERLARVLKQPLRQRLLFEYATAVVSPSKLAVTLGAPLNLVSYHTSVLYREGCLELVNVMRRRGAKEHFYRTAAPHDIHDADWELLPIRMRRMLVRSTLDLSWREAADALARGGMDDALTHVSRSFFDLDAEARQELSAVLLAAVERAKRAGEASASRRAEDVARCELVIMSFERASRP
jgi:hypothetical protein